MKYFIFGFASLLVMLAAIDIIVLNDVTRGMLGVVVAANLLILGKVDTLAGNTLAERQQERDDAIIALVDKVCPDCQSGKELLLSNDNFYCHWDGKEDRVICAAHALHDAVNSWALQLEE